MLLTGDTPSPQGGGDIENVGKKDASRGLWEEGAFGCGFGVLADQARVWSVGGPGLEVPNENKGAIRLRSRSAAGHRPSQDQTPLTPDPAVPRTRCGALLLRNVCRSRDKDWLVLHQASLCSIAPQTWTDNNVKWTLK